MLTRQQWRNRGKNKYLAEELVEKGYAKYKKQREYTDARKGVKDSSDVRLKKEKPVKKIEQAEESQEVEEEKPKPKISSPKQISTRAQFGNNAKEISRLIKEENMTHEAAKEKVYKKIKQEEKPIAKKKVKKIIEIEVSEDEEEIPSKTIGTTKK